MPSLSYRIDQADLNAIGNALTDYYDSAWHGGIMQSMDKMARANMGAVTALMDETRDTVASLQKKSKDGFMLTFKPVLSQLITQAMPTNQEVAGSLIASGTKALAGLANMIPVPGLGSLVAQGITIAGAKGQAAAHASNIAAADSLLAARTGVETDKMFTNDTEASATVLDSMKQYTVIRKYIQTIPMSISTFDDAVSYPTLVFRTQDAASKLKIMLSRVREYVAAMESRMEQVDTLVKKYRDTLSSSMPKAVDKVLQSSYQSGLTEGMNRYNPDDPRKDRYGNPAMPKLIKPPAGAGGATLLATYVAHALSTGYWDARNAGVPSRPRAGTVTGRPPLPPPFKLK